jgi:hypothetical protein
LLQAKLLYLQNPSMQESQQHRSIDVFVGVDVGKGHYHAVALDRNAKRLYKALPNDETKLRALITELKAHGQLLFVVDQPATIGALPVAVARDEGVLVAYLPGLAMRRIADLHASEAKTDARDAADIAEAARSMPHTLRSADVTGRYRVPAVSDHGREHSSGHQSLQPPSKKCSQICS